MNAHSLLIVEKELKIANAKLLLSILTETHSRKELKILSSVRGWFLHPYNVKQFIDMQMSELYGCLFL